VEDDQNFLCISSWDENTYLADLSKEAGYWIPNRILLCRYFQRSRQTPSVIAKCPNNPKTAPTLSIQATQKPVLEQILRKSLKPTTRIEALLSELL